MKLRLTDDGSHTLFVPILNENYHSTFGAIGESQHVFIRAGLESLSPKKHISVFEAGFGTGLNALCTCIFAERQKAMITYHAIENHPLGAEITDILNYPELLPQEHNAKKWFTSMHEAPWTEMVMISPCFGLHKIKDDLTLFTPDFFYDLVFFDAFAPDKQPEMWTREVFARLFGHLNHGGILTTYCVKGEIRRILKETGFEVEKLPGPPGKREMLRGRKE